MTKKCVMQMVQRAEDDGSTSSYMCTGFRCDEMTESMKRPSVCAERSNDRHTTRKDRKKRG